MKGLSLLETIVVVAVIALLSLIGVNNINNFKNDAKADNLTNELISDLRAARSKSMNGELLSGEDKDDFDPENLPSYGISISGNNYFLIRKCIKADFTTCDTEPAIESFTLDPHFIVNVTPNGPIYFERITGITQDTIIFISDINGKYARQISISADFLILVTKI